mgnify:CR=1 FL=1
MVTDEIRDFRGDTIIQKCCGYLVEFVYSKIAAKRLEAINVMEAAIQNGLDGGDFEGFVNTYFDSKFTTDLREYLYEFTIDIVWEYIEKTHGEPDSINHLRGACDRLLVENPDNPAADRNAPACCVRSPARSAVYAAARCARCRQTEFETARFP